MASEQPLIQAIAGQYAEDCRQLRRNRLLQETGTSAADALHGLVDLDGANEHLEQAFLREPSALSSAALEIAGENDDGQWCKQIFSLFTRTNLNGPIPEPHVWITSLKYLLKHQHRTGELISAISAFSEVEIGERVLLALEHAPEQALPLIRKGLLTDGIMQNVTVAAILAIIAKPWCLQELLLALQESDEQDRTAYVRAAILEINDEAANKTLLAWEQNNPHENEIGHYVERGGRRLGPFYSFSEQFLKTSAQWLQFQMQRLHDRVMKIRNVVPAKSE